MSCSSSNWAAPPADISVQTLRRQLTQLGSDGLDLAAAASASGWADASAAAAVEKVLSVPSYAQWWETKLAAPGFDVFLQELAARRVNDDAGKRHYFTFAHGGDIAEDFNRADLDDAFPQMPLTTKVALATGAALDPNWFPKMYMNHPGSCGGSVPWEGWSYAKTWEIPRLAA